MLPRMRQVATISIVMLDRLPNAFSYRLAHERGLSDRRLKGYVEDGVLERLGCGVYRKADAPPTNLDRIELALRAPEARLCLTSALSVHDLTDAIPSAIDIALPRSKRPPQASAPVRWHRFHEDTFFVEVASVEVEDGVVCLPDTITAGTIRDGDVYPGVRAVLEARLATARIKLSVDVNVGDPVVPAPTRTAVPGLLGDERIDVLAYPKAMVVAKKLVTALQRGRASTRWRDFADLFVLVPGVQPEAEVIEALRAVASHRGVSLKPLAEVLAEMPNEAQRHWATWRAQHGAEARVPEDFAAVLDVLDVATRGWIVAAAKAGVAG